MTDTVPKFDPRVAAQALDVARTAEDVSEHFARLGDVLREFSDAVAAFDRLRDAPEPPEVPVS